MEREYEREMEQAQEEFDVSSSHTVYTQWGCQQFDTGGNCLEWVHLAL